LAEDDIVMIAKKIIINAVVRKTTESTNFTECAIVNQSEVTITTEVGSKIPEAMSSREEKLKVKMNIFGEGTSEMTSTYEGGIGRWTKVTSACDGETNAVTNINEAEFVKSSRTNCNDLAAGVFLDVNLKGEMIGTGKLPVGIETLGKCSLSSGTDGGQISHAKISLKTADVKDLARDHVTEKVVILPPDLIITDTPLPVPTGRDDHLPHTVLHEAQPASRREDEVYPQGVVEKKVTGLVLREIKEVMVWDEIRCVGGVDSPCLLITVADQWTTGEGTHLLLDPTRNVEEVHPEGGEAEWAAASPTGCDRKGTGTKNLLVTEEHRGILSVAVKENTHVTGAALTMSHVIGTGGLEASYPQAAGPGTGRIEKAGVQDGAVAHHVIGECMSRRKSCVKWKKIAGADQTMKRKSGNMKKTWEMKRTKCRDTEKENDRERPLPLYRQPSLQSEEKGAEVKHRRQKK